MIRIDRKTCKDILKVTKSYDDDIFFHPSIGGFCIWTGSHPDHASVKSSSDIDEIPGSLNRLVDSKLIIKQIGTMDKGMIFHITPELLHYKAFWFDRISRKFATGFLAGVASAVAADIIFHFIAKLLG